MAEQKRKRLEKNGLVLAYTVAGRTEAPALLLLHAIRNTSRLFDNILPELAKRYRVIAVDLRGHGESVKQGPYTFEQIVEDIRALLDAEEVGQAAIAAASFSAVPAQMFAAAFPERVAHLILLDGGFYSLRELPGFDRASTVDRLAETRFPAIAAAGEYYAVRYGKDGIPSSLPESELERKEDGAYGYRLPREAFDGYFQAYATFDKEALFAALKCPVLLLLADEMTLSGETQQRFFQTAAAEYRQKVPHAICQKIPHAQHLLMLTHPRETVEGIISFVR
ncbi:alpha/beta fold hydrolase [Brevibacillus borstelensis]|uniref:alpha/beta fold hydrolase n=1 Tax=Brevibacillus borstelensis TaxID=45462 RepID=UPI0030BCC4C6